DGYALRFQIYFWVEHRSFMKAAIVQSEVLEIITDAFPAYSGEPPIAAEPASDEPASDEDAAPTAEVATDATTANGHAAAANGAGPNGAGQAGRASDLDRELTSSVRKMSRAMLKKEIRRAGKG
ncbi:MAG TPA: hypothetical protein VGG30_05385, partial [Pirellulales bacterium]